MFTIYTTTPSESFTRPTNSWQPRLGRYAMSPCHFVSVADLRAQSERERERERERESEREREKKRERESRKAERKSERARLQESERRMREGGRSHFNKLRSERAPCPLAASRFTRTVNKQQRQQHAPSDIVTRRHKLAQKPVGFAACQVTPFFF